MPSFAAILPAAGQSRRFGDQHYKKPFARLANRAVWLHAAERFANRSDVTQTIVVVGQDELEDFQAKYGANLAFMGIEVCVGGAERHDSVAAALAHVQDATDFVAVHDAARPCIRDEAIEAVFAAAAESGAAILAVPVTATLKRQRDGHPPCVETTVGREGLWAASTPQVFERDLLHRAYANRGESRATDDAQLVEALGVEIRLVEDSPLNIKITTKADLKLAESILKASPPKRSDGAAHPFGDDDLWR